MHLTKVGWKRLLMNDLVFRSIIWPRKEKCSKWVGQWMYTTSKWRRLTNCWQDRRMWVLNCDCMLWSGKKMCTLISTKCSCKGRERNIFLYKVTRKWEIEKKILLTEAACGKPFIWWIPYAMATCEIVRSFTQSIWLEEYTEHIINV